MARKIIVILAALVVPGGLVALAGAWLFKHFGQSERGRQIIAFARKTVPTFAGAWMPQRQAA